MDLIFEHYKKTGYMHHAYIIEGRKEEIVPILLSALEQHLGISVQGNPDLAVLEYQSLGINESRDLSLRQSRSGFSASVNGGKDNVSRKIFIISAESFTHEAQNALLKTFEEPTLHTHFFIIVPSLHIILPTLVSRVVLVRRGNLLSNKDDALDFAEKFLNTSSFAERFASIKKLTETRKDEIVDREKIRRILDHLERILYTRLAGKKKGAPLNTLKESDIFHEIYQTKTYLSDRGSSPKMLLEHLAIGIPLI